MARVSVSVGWTLAAVASVVALAVLAPSGLWLLGFLAVVILSHESGHLVVARWAGMRPTEYFWGFGPEVFAVERNGCRYGLKALFLGGYVQLPGMTPTAEIPEGFDEAGTSRAASHRGRVATILAGPAVNLVTAAAAFSLATWLDGEGIVAALRSGPADVWFVASGTVEALWLWGTEIGAYTSSVLDPSGDTEAPVRFLSPVAQAEVSGRVVASGTATTLRWFGVLSCAVGVVNLLPLPPLDGSHAVVALAEAVAQRLLPGRRLRFDVSRLLPLAYLTVAILVVLSASALVLDLRDIT